MATTSAVLGIGMAAASAGMAAASASQANSNARKTARNAQRQAETNKALSAVEYRDKKQKLAQSYSQYAKSASASAGIRGVGSSSSTEALRRASLASALNDQTMMGWSQTSTNWAYDARAADITNQAAASIQSPFLSGISGGISGLQMGLSLSDSIQKAGWIK
jgi:hypothetical protein